MRFVKTCLKALGLRIQFGHPPGECCTNPIPGRKNFIVIDLSSIQEVAVDFCGCENRGAAGSLDTQLLRGGWFPASEERPQTCMTLVALEHFHMETLQAKTTMYDFYKTREKLTSNDGTKPRDRYQVFIRICREYRDVMMLKRAGLGHHPQGACGGKPGDCAIRCPCCPRPGVNLPEDWERASKEDRFVHPDARSPPANESFRFLYILFLALDACFRLKRGLVSSDLKDPGLSTGLSYMTENVPYREYLRTVTDQNEVCCSLNVLDSTPDDALAR